MPGVQVKVKGSVKTDFADTWCPVGLKLDQSDPPGIAADGDVDSASDELEIRATGSGAGDNTDDDDHSLGDAAACDRDSINASANHMCTSTGNEMWGLFGFLTVGRVVQASASSADRLIRHQMQVTCPFHTDGHDKPGTKWRRTMGFGDSNRETVVRQCKCWCLGGRSELHRATGVKKLLPHRWLKTASHPPDDATLNSALHASL